ncbi:RagB/SusD family nutrient uptake outer membrane protein [Ferruginibacter albus]|uniref:RagB/SusD family nutrient uptake outer membrane protein n=1 Tax=Ferruginibacter albus TaxID=2875540 RepID=UPI001CC4AAF8|nr:RagB/SusD family nutrient uptake outer membrane protein [Ferruginibacter albus]UAY51562.1 RagB/SusD family nutrient uptake outer membrane protein [Ferruginibacter albus]
MKRELKILLYGIFLIAISSCTKEFLDVPVQGSETPISDPSLAQKLVVGTYNSLLQGDSWNTGDVDGFALIAATDIMSDDADKGSYADDQATTAGEFDNFTLSSTNEFAATLWRGHYNSIGAANYALKNLYIANIDTATKNELIGEVRFLRGYLYFNMVRMFGGVPLVLKIPQDLNEALTDSVLKVRAPAALVYDSIEADLQYAIDHLPLQNTGHATKGAAQSMLAKVYMYQNQWQKVFDLTNQVIASGIYQLLPDYATLFRQAGDNSIESVFEIETGAFNNTNLGIANYTVSQGPRVGGLGGWDDLGWGFCNPTPSLIAAYETGDVRKDATIIFIDNSGTHRGTVLWDGFRIPSSDSVQNLYYNYKAYTSKAKEKFADAGTKDRPKNVHILRYAEVLLMNAEAALQPDVNQPAQAADDINLIRTRANLFPKGSVTINDVWQERHVELAMEHDRFWDIVRQGRAAQVMTAAGKNFAAGKNELLPIPSTQIQLSGGALKQNPGY